MRCDVESYLLQGKFNFVLIRAMQPFSSVPAQDMPFNYALYNSVSSPCSGFHSRLITDSIYFASRKDMITCNLNGHLDGGHLASWALVCWWRQLAPSIMVKNLQEMVQSGTEQQGDISAYDGSRHKVACRELSAGGGSWTRATLQNPFNTVLNVVYEKASIIQ